MGILADWIDNKPLPAPVHRAVEIDPLPSSLEVQMIALDLFRRVHGVRAIPELQPHDWQECVEDAEAYVQDQQEVR